MIKNKRARRTAKTLRQIKLRWVRKLYWISVSMSSQRLLSTKHMHSYDPEKVKLEAIECMEKIVSNKKQQNKLIKQINKYKLK